MRKNMLASPTTAPAPGTVLHAVTGSAGMYSDFSWWVVAVYLDRAKAEEHQKLVHEWHSAERAKFIEDGTYSYEPKEKNPYDTAEYGANSLLSDIDYTVSVFFVHADPMKHLAEEATLMDYCREQGWIP